MSRVRIVSVIDDDESVRRALDCLLRSLGFISHSFATAGDLLNSPRLQDSDCIVADIQMPGMGGLELQKALRTVGLQLPIIFITAFPDRRIRERAEAAGAVAFLEKPFEAQLIVKSLELAFARRDQADLAPPQT